MSNGASAQRNSSDRGGEFRVRADVAKVENPKGGDLLRGAEYDVGVRAFSIDLTLFRRTAARADTVIEFPTWRHGEARQRLERAEGGG